MVMTPERFYKMKYDVLSERVKGYEDNFGIPLSSLTSGTNVISPSKSLQIETVYTCIRDKAETVGRLPVVLYEKDNTGITRSESGRLHRIFTKQPCEFMTMQGFMEFMTASYELHGAFYAYLSYNDRGSIMEIIPFKNQTGVTPQMDVNGRVYYQYVTNDGQVKLSFGIDELFIVNQFTLDGFTPVSPIRQSGQMLNGVYETEETWSSLQRDGITSQFALKTDKSIRPDAVDRIKKDWKTFRGAPGVGNIPVLEDGLDIKSLQLSPKDVELLQSRQYSVNRICRIFRVPPERIGVGEKLGSGQTTLDVDEAYMRNSIEPILIKYEHACNMLLDKLKVSKFIRINRKAFYNGSPHRMIEALGAELKIGGCTINEMRIDMGRDPVDGGDVFAIDTNNLTFGAWNELKSVQEQITGRAAQGGTNEQTTSN